MSYRIPKEFINKKDVKIILSEGINNTISIEFSKRLEDELSKWPRWKMNDIMDDIKTDIDWGFNYEPIGSDTLDNIYHRIFSTLSQVY